MHDQLIVCRPGHALPCLMCAHQHFALANLIAPHANLLGAEQAHQAIGLLCTLVFSAPFETHAARCVCQRAGGTSKHPQLSCNCSKLRLLLSLATVSHNVQSDKFAPTGNLVYLVTTDCEQVCSCYDLLRLIAFPVTHS